MKTTLSYLAVSAMFVFSLSSCDKNADNENSAAEKTAAEPTRDAAVTLLTDLAQKLEANDHDAAAKMLRAPSGVDAAQISKAVAQFVPRKEISSAGVKILAKKGKWGKLTEVLPKRGKRFAERAGVDAESCYALTLENAEAAFLWEDGQFLIIRCDDIGKLGAAPEKLSPEAALKLPPKKLTPQELLEKKNYYTPENLKSARQIIAGMKPELRAQIIEHMKARQKIKAIKALRATHTSSLAISKLTVELIAIKDGVDPRIF